MLSATWAFGRPIGVKVSPTCDSERSEVRFQDSGGVHRTPETGESASSALHRKSRSLSRPQARSSGARNACEIYDSLFHYSAILLHNAAFLSYGI